jgi:hypothetical protein
LSEGDNEIPGFGPEGRTSSPSSSSAAGIGVYGRVAAADAVGAAPSMYRRVDEGGRRKK